VADEFVVELDPNSRGGHPFAQGGNSKLYAWGGSAEPMVFKRFEARYAARPLLLTGLRDQAAWRMRLPAEERRELDTFAAWPRRVVTLEGQLHGVLIPRAGEVFLTTDPIDGRSKGRDLSTLADRGSAARSDQTTWLSRRVPAALGVIGQLAHRIGWLHERGVLVNDLRAENVLITEDALESYLVDCDSMAGPWGNGGGAAASDNLRGNLYDRNACSEAVDYEKLAWCVIRVVTTDSALTRHLPADVPRRLHAVMTRSAVGLVRASLDPTTYPEQPHRGRDWRELGTLWVLAAGHGLIRTDAGLQPWRPDETIVDPRPYEPWILPPPLGASDDSAPLAPGPPPASPQASNPGGAGPVYRPDPAESQPAVETPRPSPYQPPAPSNQIGPVAAPFPAGPVLPPFRGPRSGLSWRQRWDLLTVQLERFGLTQRPSTVVIWLGLGSVAVLIAVIVALAVLS
jgi:hypothetical protein